MNPEPWLLALASSPVLYLVVFAAATVDGFFPPVPSESVVIAAAALGWTWGEPEVGLVLVAATAGAFTGDQIAFAVGRRVDVGSLRILRGARGRRAVATAERALSTRAAPLVIGARYVPVGRVAVNMSAGAVGFPRRRFVVLTAVAASTWALYATALGWGAAAWFGGSPLLAVVAGVVVGGLIGLAVDAVMRRVGHDAVLAEAYR